MCLILKTIFSLFGLRNLCSRLLPLILALTRGLNTRGDDDDFGKRTSKIYLRHSQYCFLQIRFPHHPYGATHHLGDEDFSKYGIYLTMMMPICAKKIFASFWVLFWLFFFYFFRGQDLVLRRKSRIHKVDKDIRQVSMK